MLLVSVAAVFVAHFKIIIVVGQKNGEFLLSKYALVEERWDHPRLQLLRKREKLDQVVAGGKTQFEKIVLLRKWAHDQWRSRGQFYYPPWDAVEILDLARQHHNYGFCAQYAIVFAQACRSLGLHVRYVDTGHFMAGVWSDDFGHWVVMDPTDDIHYERNGIPLRGREMYEAYWGKDWKGIERVGSDGSKTPITPGETQNFARLSFLLRTNHLSVPGKFRINGRLVPLVHKDDYRQYLLGGRDPLEYADDFVAWETVKSTAAWDAYRPITDDPDDLRDVFNQTIIIVAAKNPSRSLVKVKLLVCQ